MATVLCHICLRTDITAVNIATELVYFIEELCEYNIINDPRYKYCSICAHLLKKFYNFKQRCLKACKILKSFNGRHQFLPTDLHEQLPSSIGLCTSLPPYKLLQYQHHTDINLLESKPDLNIEPNVTPNNIEVYNQQNLTTDPTLPVHIKVKNEPMHDVPDSNVKTLQAASGKNLYLITTSDGKLILRSDFEDEIRSTKLDKEKLNVFKDANQSKINEFLKNFEKEIKDDDYTVNANDMEVEDSTYMLNNDPLKDDESLNSMDDIESDISDSDVKSINLDEENADSNPELDSDSDTDSLIEFFEDAIQNKKLKVSKINDLELAETLLKLDRKNKLLKKRVQVLKCKAVIESDLLKLFENDGYDLGDGVRISKEVFLKIYKQYENNPSKYHNLKDVSDKKKTHEFLRFLYKMYNPEYLTVFDIEYLDTEEKKLQEFSRRKDSAEYQSSPYQCERCYKGFQLEGLHAYHMKKHDESLGGLECRICTVRFFTEAARRAHVLHCHSAVYVCRLCNVTFYYFASMKNHYDTHKGVEHRCSQCDGIFRTSSSLLNHKRSHATSHVCTTCARVFASSYGLYMHRRHKHREAPEPDASGTVRCAECDLTLDSRKAYESHLRKSHRPDRYICMCLAKFSSLAELRQHRVAEGHLRYDNTRKLLIGPYEKGKRGAVKSTGTSGKSTGTSGKRTGTSGKSKGKSVKKFKAALRTCPICQEQVPNKYGSSLYCHFAEHHPGEPYRRPEGMQRRDLLCEQCGQTFNYPSLLIDHKNTHLGLRPYACDACPERFPTRQLRSMHRSTRHSAALTPCEHCGKTFNSMANRFVHMRGHANIRCFKCKICDAGFNHPAAMREHVRGVHLRQRRPRAPRKKPLESEGGSQPLED